MSEVITMAYSEICRRQGIFAKGKNYAQLMSKLRIQAFYVFLLRLFRQKLKFRI